MQMRLLQHPMNHLSIVFTHFDVMRQIKKTCSTALTKLILRVKKLEKTGRKIFDIDEDPNISLVQDEEMTWFQDADAEVQEDTNIQIRTSDDTELVIEEEEPTKVVEDQGSGEKGEKEVTTLVNFQTYIRRKRRVSTGSGGVSTATRLDSTDDVSTASEIGSTAAEKKKDKGKATITEPEPEKKSKKQLEQERLDFEEALQENIHTASQEQEKQRVVTKADPTKVINSSDPYVIRYHAQLNRPRSVAEVRTNMYKYLCNQARYMMRNFKGMTYDDIRPIFEKVFEDMIKNFDREDLLNLWSLVQERFNSPGLTEDKEKELYIEMKMLFDPDEENLLELQRYMHDPLKLWLYDTYVVHHVSTKREQDIFMLIEKDYPLTKGLATLILCNKLRMDHHSEMANELLTKIFNIANRPRQ
ncbi:hypothetical protein Tco_1347513 [Tanacetum coccineum]